MVSLLTPSNVNGQLKKQIGQDTGLPQCISSQELKKSSNRNVLYQEMSTRSGSSLVLRVPINFYSYTCKNI